MSRLITLARQRIDDSPRTHWEGCEADHRECLIQRLADALETAERDAAICRDAVEECYYAVDGLCDDLEGDEAQGLRRTTLRRLNEAVGKATPRLLHEKPEGQKLYGLRWRELTKELTEKDAEIARLHAFARDVLEPWPEGALDGGELQDVAVKHGLLVPEMRFAPCAAEVCKCAEYYASSEWSEGVTCYRLAPELKKKAREGGQAGVEHLLALYHRAPKVGSSDYEGEVSYEGYRRLPCAFDAEGVADLTDFMFPMVTQEAAVFVTHLAVIDGKGTIVGAMRLPVEQVLSRASQLVLGGRLRLPSPPSEQADEDTSAPDLKEKT